jgi:formate hydrogenlyase transcriptional activator
MKSSTQVGRVTSSANSPHANGTSPPATPLSQSEAEDLVGRLTDLLSARQRTTRDDGDREPCRADARYRALVEQIPAVTFMAALDGSASELYVSPQIEELLGFSAQEWLDQPFLWYRQLHPEDQAHWVDDFARACFSGERFRAEFRFLTRDGRIVWVHGEAKLVCDDNGVPAFLHGVAFDITERKRAEESVATAYEEIRRLTNQLQADNAYLQEEMKLKYNYDEIVGQSLGIRRVLHQVEQVAGTTATVLILGETGTGKELLARAIHNRSPRAARPIVSLSAAALPATLVESELFGHEKGAYTGALSRQIGRFEQADGSTLFLDEIGELPLDVQVKLLRFLQEHRFERLGSTRTLSADVRVIAASNRDLEQMVKEGRFREDLFYRLNVFPIWLPPLRDRADDIPLLVWAFVKEFGRTLGKSIETISRATMDALKRYAWPGNIRELRNVIERAMIVNQGPVLQVEPPLLPCTRPFAPASVPVPEPAELADAGVTLAESQRRHILSVLERTGWRVSGKNGAAVMLGLKPTTLESRMAKLGIKRAR